MEQVIMKAISREQFKAENETLLNSLAKDQHTPVENVVNVHYAYYLRELDI